MSTNVNDTPTITSGAVNEVPRVSALTSQPNASDATAGRVPRMITRTHQPIAYAGAARRRAPKNCHSWRARSRSVIITLPIISERTEDYARAWVRDRRNRQWRDEEQRHGARRRRAISDRPDGRGPQQGHGG